MSKGGGSQTVTQEIDPDAKAGYLTNLDYARDVANQMGSRQFAGFNPQYQLVSSRFKLQPKAAPVCRTLTRLQI